MLQHIEEQQTTETTLPILTNVQEAQETVETEANVDDEIRYLCATLTAEPH